MFKFREDNREKIDQNHVKRLKESISSKNLLDLRPIIVNSDYEVIDGQHRLLAAQALNVDIYYEIKNELNDPLDVILMNTSKSWGINDYLNFYVKHKYPEYLKLKSYMVSQNLPVRTAVTLCSGRKKFSFPDFKAGKFVYEEIANQELVDMCWDTINYLKKMNGFCAFTESSRFWVALVKLVSHENFNFQKWNQNLSKMVQRVCAKATSKDYCAMLMNIYNFQNREKIDISEE